MRNSFFLLFFVMMTMQALEAKENGKLDLGEVEKIKESYEKSMSLPGAAMFTPPEGWLVSDPGSLPPHVHGMVVGPAKSYFPPSINLGAEMFSGNEGEYMARIRQLNENQGFETKDLGKIRTEAGNAHLIQVETTNEWGELRLLQAIFFRENMAYIITAAALKDEFPDYYKEFFSGIRSFRINPTLFEMVEDETRRESLRRMRKALEESFEQKIAHSGGFNRQEFFSDPSFREEWNRFEEEMEKDFQDLGREWLAQYLKEVEQDLVYKS